MPSKVYVTNQQKRVAVDSGQVRRAAQKILALLGYDGYELSIVITDDHEITRLNRQYFRRNRSTNVISFPMIADSLPPPPNRILGDVVISAETARRQAGKAGGRAKEEVFFLLIHGILHLTGYDHEGAKEEREKMEEKEKEIFLRIIQPQRTQRGRAATKKFKIATNPIRQG